MKDLIIIGASGFGKEVAWLVERINEVNPTWNLIGFIDDNDFLHGSLINGYTVLGGIDTISSFLDAYFVCAIGTSHIRAKVIKRIVSYYPNIKFATLIDPSAQKASSTVIGRGSIICAGNILTVNINIGQHVIINLDCTIGHSAVIADYVTLCPSVNISGDVFIDNTTEIGTGAQVIQGKHIGESSMIGAGAVIIEDIPNGCTAVGVPAKVIKNNNWTL